jgi:ribosomal protein S17E
MDSKTYHSQLKKVFQELKKEPQTMLQVSVKSGILRANICRYIRTLRKRKQVAVTKVDKCPLSNHKAQFFTTDKALFPADPQTTMFEGVE